MIKIYDRKKDGYYIEDEHAKESLEQLYNTIHGRILLKMFYSNRIYSKIVALSEKSCFSKRKIAPFIDKYNINLDEYENKNYKSFDDFFTRKKKSEFLEVDKNTKSFIAPCDGKLQVFKIDKALRLKVKGSLYNLSELLEDERIVDRYRGGTCLVYRLSVDDYHRYCHIDSGKPLMSRFIKGKLHTVRPIAKRYNVFKENQREYVVLDTENLGEIIYMEVGAIQIGKINNYNLHKFKKGQEKGYFSYGASTIVIFLQEGKVKLDEDIIEMSKKNIEVKVKYGEKIGYIENIR